MQVDNTWELSGGPGPDAESWTVEADEFKGCEQAKKVVLYNIDMAQVHTSVLKRGLGYRPLLHKECIRESPLSFKIVGSGPFEPQNCEA